MRQKTFTLLELMVVVAVLMVLAAMAVPLMHETQLKARRAELLPMVDGLQAAHAAYHAASDAWVSTGAYGPDAWPSKVLRPWQGVPETGFQPDGDVRGSYVLAAPGESTCVPDAFGQDTCPFGEEACAGGMTDLDENALRACARATTTLTATLTDVSRY